MWVSRGSGSIQIDVLDPLAGTHLAGKPVRHRGLQLLPGNMRGQHRKRFTQINHLIQAATEKIVDLAHEENRQSPGK